MFSIYLLTLTLSVDGASSSSCNLLGDPIKILNCKVEDLLKSDMIQNQVLENMPRINTGHACSRNICGQCACQVDHQLNKKYYCNCQHLGPMRDCLAFRNEGFNISGMYLINMKDTKTVEVFCDQETDDGGWTVFQRRMNGEIYFYRDWLSYKEGFGIPHREFWLGNDNLYLLTYQAEYPGGSELRVDLEDWSRNKKYAKYSTFSIDNEQRKYELFVEGYSGDAGDSLGVQNGQKFSTYDADNDVSKISCAVNFRAAWWYKNCMDSNLNGEYRLFGEKFDGWKGVIWYKFKQSDLHSMKFAEMKVRRKE